MRRRELYGGNLYTYSVKYNYEGGQIFADGELVGTVTDVNTPVVFQSEKPETIISVTGKPDDKKQLTGTERVEEWGKIENIDWTFTFQLQRGRAEGNTLYFRGRITKGDSSAMTREKKIYDVNSYRLTTYQEPVDKTAMHGENVSMSYTSSTSSDEEWILVETITGQTDYISNDDYIIAKIDFPVYIHTPTMQSESQNFLIYKSGSLSELEEWVDYSLTFNDEIMVYYLPLVHEKPKAGTAKVSNYNVDIMYGEI